MPVFGGSAVGRLLAMAPVRVKIYISSKRESPRQLVTLCAAFFLYLFATLRVSRG